MLCKILHSFGFVEIRCARENKSLTSGVLSFTAWNRKEYFLVNEALHLCNTQKSSYGIQCVGQASHAQPCQCFGSGNKSTLAKLV